MQPCPDIGLTLFRTGVAIAVTHTIDIFCLGDWGPVGKEKNGSCAAPNACVLTWVMSIGCVCTLYAGNGCPCHFPLRLHTAAAPCAVAVAHTNRYSMAEIAAFPRFLGLGRQKSRSSPLSAPILDEKLMNGGEKRRY